MTASWSFRLRSSSLHEAALAHVLHVDVDALPLLGDRVRELAPAPGLDLDELAVLALDDLGHAGLDLLGRVGVDVGAQDVDRLVLLRLRRTCVRRAIAIGFSSWPVRVRTELGSSADVARGT